MKFITRFIIGIAAAIAFAAPAAAQQVLRSQTVSFDNYAALEAVPFARFSAGAAVIISENGRAGTFIKVTTNQSALATADPDKCVFIPSPQDTDGSSGGWVREDWLKDPDTVNVLWCGVLADFVTASQTGTDNASKFNNASALASTIIIPEGNYKLASTWNINQVGAVIKGGNRNSTGLYISHTSGCGVMIDGRLWEMEDLGIYSSDARWASTDYANDHQLCVGDPLDAPGGSLTTHTQSKLTRMNIFGAPGDGVHWVGTGSNSEISQSQISYNKRNGILLDDGSSDGFTSTDRNGIMNLNMLNLKDNGGYAIAATAPITGSGTTFRVIIDNPEVGNNAWNFATLNAAFTGQYVNANIYIRGQQVEIRGGGIGDNAWNGVAMEAASGAGSASGSPRCRHATATNYPTCTGGGKSAQGNMIYIDGASSQSKISQTRLLGYTTDNTQDAVPLIFIAGSQESIIIENPYATGTPDYVIEAGNNVKGLVVMMGSDETGAASIGWNTGPIKTGGVGTEGIVIMEGQIYRLTGAAPYLQMMPSFDGSVSRTIVSGSINLNGSTLFGSDNHFLTADTQSAAATDDLDFVTGGVDGDLLIVQSADNARDVTLRKRQSGTGEFFMNTDIVLNYVTDKAFFVYYNSAWNLLGSSTTFSPALKGGHIISATLSSPAGDDHGIATVTGSNMEFDTEAAAASDTLDCLIGGEIGEIIVVHQADNARDITYTDSFGSCSAGEASMSLAGNFVATSLQDTLTLIKISTTAWREISRSDNL